MNFVIILYTIFAENARFCVKKANTFQFIYYIIVIDKAMQITDNIVGNIDYLMLLSVNYGKIKERMDDYVKTIDVRIS